MYAFTRVVIKDLTAEAKAKDLAAEAKAKDLIPRPRPRYVSERSLSIMLMSMSCYK